MTEQESNNNNQEVPLTETYFRLLRVGISEEGFSMPSAVCRPRKQENVAVGSDGKKAIAIEMHALMIDVSAYFTWFWKCVLSGKYNEIVFGLDRFTKPGQGTEFDDALTVIHWSIRERPIEEYIKNPISAIRIGVVNYKFDTTPEQSIIRPIDWENTFWSMRVHEELHRSLRQVLSGQKDLRKAMQVHVLHDAKSHEDTDVSPQVLHAGLTDMQEPHI